MCSSLVVPLLFTCALALGGRLFAVPFELRPPLCLPLLLLLHTLFVVALFASPLFHLLLLVCLFSAHLVGPLLGLALCSNPLCFPLAGFIGTLLRLAFRSRRAALSRRSAAFFAFSFFASSLDFFSRLS